MSLLKNWRATVPLALGLAFVLTSGAESSDAPSVCAVDGPDFRLTLSYGNGTVPPQWKWDWTITLEAGSEGQIAVWTEYETEESAATVRTFPVSEGAHEDLFERFSELDLGSLTPGEPAVGGSSFSMRVQCGEQVTDLDGFMEGRARSSMFGLARAAVAVVPNRIWGEFEDLVGADIRPSF